MTDIEALREAARRCVVAEAAGMSRMTDFRTASADAFAELRQVFGSCATMVDQGHSPNPTIVARARILIGEDKP